MAKSPAKALAGIETGIADLNVSLLDLGVPIRAGATLVAPAASALIVDTGQLAAASYQLIVMMGASDVAAAGKGVILEHRNAANSANIWAVHHPAGSGSVVLRIDKLVVALNERVRVINDTVVGAAGAKFSAAIHLTPLT